MHTTTQFNVFTISTVISTNKHEDLNSRYNRSLRNTSDEKLR